MESGAITAFFDEQNVQCHALVCLSHHGIDNVI